MKIGIICPYNILKGGGVQEHVKALKAELDKRGHTAIIITPMPRDSEVGPMPGVIFVGTSTDFRSPMHTSVQISATAASATIDRVLEQEQFDILHFHEPWIPVISRQILQRSKAINIATFHAKVPETLMSRTVIRVVTPYTKSVLKYFHQFTAVSESALEYASSLTDEPFEIIPNGIDLKAYKVAKHSKSAKHPKKILYIGRLERRKGVNYLLKAFELLQKDNPDVSLVIAGAGPDREKLELLSEDLELKNVEFLGYISDQEKHKLLSEADLFCSPAVYGESFGIVLLEAMATGLVAVAGNNSGYADLMQGVGALSIVNPKDSMEFARRLESLLYEETLRALWREWAKDYVPQFSYERIVDKYETLYRQVLARNGK
ncbi:MAG: glycosyltransferase family 1 protein [Candidatus Saccharibacteria bacterium]|nr:glycosyltransferase family 1 protein [Candidatus Saccharibacteria bacterium]